MKNSRGNVQTFRAACCFPSLTLLENRCGVFPTEDDAYGDDNDDDPSSSLWVKSDDYGFQLDEHEARRYLVRHCFDIAERHNVPVEEVIVGELQSY